MSSNRFKISDQPLSIVFHTGSTCHAKKELSSAKNKKAIPELKETASNDKPLENPETCPNSFRKMLAYKSRLTWDL